jgi:hypothetical protein
MLAGAGFGYDPCFAQPLRKQYLANRIIDLMRACMAEVFPL